MHDETQSDPVEPNIFFRDENRNDSPKIKSKSPLLDYIA